MILQLVSSCLPLTSPLDLKIYPVFGCLTAIGGCMWYGIIEDKWATMGTMIDAKGYRAVDSQFKPAQKDMDAQANKQ